MFRTLFSALLLTVSASAFAANEPANADAITGLWITKGGGYVQIYDAGDTYKGVIVGSLSGKHRYDTKNPDPDLRGRPLLGAVIIHGLEYEGDKTWGGGRIYDPNKGETYDLTATLQSPDKLEVRGYIGISLLGRSQIWHSITLDAPHIAEDKLVGKLAEKAARKNAGAPSEQGNTAQAHDHDEKNPQGES